MIQLKILVVDDEPIVGKRLKPALAKVGHQVDVVESGLEALRKIEENSYDIVVTDIRMEGVDGIEVLRQAKARSAQTLVIMITGFATVDSAKEALKLGAFDFIAKPFKLEDLRSTIMRAAEKLAEANTMKGPANAV
jgi:DNA-binding NtrC family response regulator